MHEVYHPRLSWKKRSQSAYYFSQHIVNRFLFLKNHLNKGIGKDRSYQNEFKILSQKTYWKSETIMIPET